jgi:protein translocase SEC61 complex gamma subunit
VAAFGASRRRILSTLHEWKLVLLRVRKPDREEFVQALKVISLGIAIIGGLAYIIHLTAVVLLGGV